MTSIAGKWGYSEWPEEGYQGAFDTREEAIEAGRAEAEGGTFWIGRYRAPILEKAIDASDVLEKVIEEDDYSGDWADGALECTMAQRDELTQELRRVFGLWLDRHGLRPTFGIVEESEEIGAEVEG